MSNNKNAFSWQRKAKLAGFLCLFFSLGSMLHYSFIDLKLFLADKPVEVLQFIKSNEILFQMGMIGDIVLYVAVLWMANLLYQLLKPIHANLAMVALFWIGVETALALNNELSSFQLLYLVNGKGAYAGLEQAQLLATLEDMIEAREAGNRLVILCFNIGLLIFSYLFYRSNYIPRLLSVLGIVTTSFMTILILIKLLLSIELGVIGMIASLLLLVFQLVLGVWLLWKGINLESKQAE